MKTIKGPAIFLAQFVDKKAPFNSLEGMCKWASDLGYKGIQIPTWEHFLIDLDKAAESQDYCDELLGKVKSYGLEITELSTHLQGQLVAVHPAYDLMFDNFAPDNLKNNPKARTEWAVETVKKAAIASKRLGLKTHATFSGALLWHTWHPWPQSPKGLVELGFKELAKRWTPILNVKDAEFNPNGKKGVYGGYLDWADRAGRYRSPGDGQIDFKTIFSKLTEYGCDLWAVMEWECCIKSPEQGAREGVTFIENLIINCTDKKFDDFAGGEKNEDDLKNILNI